MDQEFQFSIDSITKKEYVQAGTESIRRLTLPLLIMVAVATVVISLAISDFSYKSIVPPFAIAIVAVFLLRLSVVLSWKHYPADTPFSYVINKKGWELTLGDEVVFIDWRDTARFTVRQKVILLYNESNRSNLLPRRCVTPEQAAQMKEWFDSTRGNYKYRQKQAENKYRAEYRAQKSAEKRSAQLRRRKRR